MLYNTKGYMQSRFSLLLPALHHPCWETNVILSAFKYSRPMWPKRSQKHDGSNVIWEAKGWFQSHQKTHFTNPLVSLCEQSYHNKHKFTIKRKNNSHFRSRQGPHHKCANDQMAWTKFCDQCDSISVGLRHSKKGIWNLKISIVFVFYFNKV